MEGLVLHGAAHIFFENKLGELETHINSKFKRMEIKLKKEMKEIFQYQQHEMSKLKLDVKEIKEELSDLRQTEENITHKGMTKISKLSKEVKTELNEIKKLKTDVNGLKKDVIGIRKSEEDLSKLGMDTLSKMSEEFKTEVKQVKNDMKSVKKDIVSIKQAFKSRSRPETPEQKTECLDISEFLEPEKPKTPRSTRKKTNSYREPKVPPTIVELFNSSEEEQDRKVDVGCSKMAGGDLPPDPDNDAAAAAHDGEKSVLQSVVGSNFEDNYLENFNDDHIRYTLYIHIKENLLITYYNMSGSLCSALRSLLTIIMNPLTIMRVMLSVMKTEMGTLINPTMSREYFPRSFCINKVLFYLLNVHIC